MKNTEAETALHALIEARGKASRGDWQSFDHRQDDGGYWVGYDHPEYGEVTFAACGFGCEEAEEQGGSNEENSSFIAFAANWVSDHAPTILAEREKDRARIETLQYALQYARNLIGPDSIIDAALTEGAQA